MIVILWLVRGSLGGTLIAQLHLTRLLRRLMSFYVITYVKLCHLIKMAAAILRRFTWDASPRGFTFL